MKLMRCAVTVGALLVLGGTGAAAEKRSSRAEAVAAAAATQTAAPAGGSLGTVEVVTAEQIAAAAAPDVRAALGLVPGLVFNDTGGPGGVATVSLRGSTPQQVLVLLDGHRLAGAQSSFNINDLPVPIERVERIEVVPHPASALYGADALGGVVNIVTRAVGAKPGLALGAGLGADSERRFAGGVQYGVGKLGLRLDGQLRSGDGFRDNGDFDLKSAAASLAVAPAPWGLDLRWTTFRRDAGVPGPVSSPSPNARQDDGRDEVRAGVTYRPGSRWEAAVGAYSLRQSLDFEDPDPPEPDAATPAAPVESSLENRSRGVEGRLNLDTGAGELFTFGGEWVADSLEGTADGDHDTDRWGVFAQDQWHYGNWSAVGAARRDSHSVYGGRTTLSLAAGWEAGGWKFSGTWAQGYRAPSFDELYRNEASGQGNADLKPETSTSYEGCAQFGSGGGRIRLSVFRRDVTDLIRWADADGDSVLRPENVASAQVDGWEAEAVYRPSATFEIPVSYQRLSADDEETGERLAGSVRSLWRAGVRSVGSAFTWSADYTVTDRGSFQSTDGSWSYAVLNAALVWRHAFSSAAMQIGVHAENLLDEDYQTEEGFPQRGRSLFAEARIEL
jgi:outer membrane cobalamin receptor